MIVINLYMYYNLIITIIKCTSIAHIWTFYAFAMNDLFFSEKDSIIVSEIGKLSANTPFLHVDRFAKTHVLIYVISGCIYVSEEDTDYEIMPGEMLLLKQGTHQYGKKMIKSGTTWIYAHFYINEHYSQSECESDDYSNDNKVIQLPKYISNLNRTSFPIKLNNLVSVSGSGQTLCMNRVAMGLQSLLLDVYDYTRPVTPPSMSERITEYLQANICNSLQSSDIEKEFHLSYKHLSKVFHMDTGMSIMYYHNMIKIQAAARDLRSGDQSITAISARYAFGDPLYFSRCFKKYMGSSPRAYRKIQSIF